MDEAISGITGGISGFLSILVWYPIENFRLRLQSKDLNQKDEKTLDRKEYHKLTDELSPNEENLNHLIITEKEKIEKEIRIEPTCGSKLKKLLKTIIEFLRKLNLTELKSLYKGISSGLFGNIITNGVYFFAYKYWQKIFLKMNMGLKQGNIYFSLISSLFAAITCAFVTNPIWVLHTRMANSSDHKISNYEMFWLILEKEGISGFFKGLIPSLFLTINPIIQYIIYEYLRARLVDASGNISSKNIIIISVISKFITTLVTYPALTIKTLYQANEKKTAKEIKDLVVQMIGENGFLYLYKGLNAKIVQTLLNNIIVMLSYEKIQFLVRIALIGIVSKFKKDKVPLVKD